MKGAVTSVEGRSLLETSREGVDSPFPSGPRKPEGRASTVTIHTGRLPGTQEGGGEGTEIGKGKQKPLAQGLSACEQDSSASSATSESSWRQVASHCELRRCPPGWRFLAVGGADTSSCVSGGARGGHSMSGSRARHRRCWTMTMREPERAGWETGRKCGAHMAGETGELGSWKGSLPSVGRADGKRI